MSETKNIHEILAKYWGYDSFRDKQEDIIQAVLSGKDTLALLPTGGGKSICFQVPALAKDGLCLVVSPLIALMQDQVSNLKKRNIKALSITSGMTKREIDIALDNAAYGNYKFLYVSPERLETELFKARLAKMNVNLVAIDEAHCISQWGYDFRPSYLNIVQLREQLPNVPFLALTATATIQVVEDIQEKLAFKKKHVIQKSFERSNLAYVVLHEENQFEKMMRIIDGVKGSGIIYVNSRRRTKEVAQVLLNHTIAADYYHAGLSHEERKQKQHNWVNNQCRIIVATNAFGMGIDKPDVRFVIHIDVPNSLEAYFQEAGRAGRDERKAYAVLLASPTLAEDLKARVKQSFPALEKIKATYLALSNYLQIPIDGGENQNYELDLADFSKRYQFDLFETYHCLHFLEKENYIVLSENFAMPSRLHILLNNEDLYKFQVQHKNYDVFIKTLLRTYGGLFDDFVKINEQQIADNTKMPVAKVKEYLLRLQELEILNYEPKSHLPKVTYTKPRLDQKSLRISKSTYHDRKKIAEEKVAAVIDYVETKTRCRSQVLLAYFGETTASNCGVCDTCLDRKKHDLSPADFKAIETSLMHLIPDEGILLIKLVAKIKGFKKDSIVKVIDYLADHEKLYISSGKISKPKS
ncbi:MAG: RecQ family ATP-dependent DNA helicase [Flavobacteriales bacterium]|nr:RecQ family ATP-dependent DNA helicase [Flavobacteriales bacterium]